MLTWDWGWASKQSTPVLILWGIEWAAMLFLSRFARRKSRQGDTKWGNYALLPVYEFVIWCGVLTSECMS